MENRRPISYGFEDIKRYKQGLMSKEEMHAFEKASMEDPFLADALEGYMQADITIAEQHHSAISERLRGNSEEKDKAIVVPMQKRSFAMWRVAAMVIVIGGAGLLAYNIFDKGNTPATSPMAKVEEPATSPKINTTPPVDAQKEASVVSVPKQQPVTPEVSIKKSGTASGTAVNSQTTEQTSTFNTTTNDVAALKDDKNQQEVAKASVKETDEKRKSEKAAAPVVEEVVVTDAYGNKRNSSEVATATNQIRGRVLSPENRPVVNANIRLEDGNRTFVTDRSGNFVLNAPDTVVNATVASQGYTDTRVQLRSNTNNTINLGTIQLKQDESFMNDVVVVDVGAKRVKVSDTTSNKPFGGWESFQDYVSKTLGITPDTSSTVDDDNSADIEFFVDAKGVARDIKIFNATTAIKAKETELVQALKKGPKWATKNKKIRIQIRY